MMQSYIFQTNCCEFHDSDSSTEQSSSCDDDMLALLDMPGDSHMVTIVSIKTRKVNGNEPRLYHLVAGQVDNKSFEYCEEAEGNFETNELYNDSLYALIEQSCHSSFYSMLSPAEQ